MKIREPKPDPCDDNPGLEAEVAEKMKIPPLWEVVVTGWAGIASPESGVKLIEECTACGLKVYSDFKDSSRLIDERQWDGSDFFMVWPFPRFIFVTDRVADFIRKNRLIGAELRRLSDLKPGLLAKASPGRLSYWMPEPRAKEIGEALSIY